MSTQQLSPETEDRIGRYTVAMPEPVGEGGFGKVHRGRDELLGRDVAIKQLDKAWNSAGDEEKERFRREARTLAKMSHPNIPAIYDVVQTEDRFEIVFQFIEGRTLRDILDKEEAIKLSDARLWFDQIASALSHAHDAGIIHRDIKPDNMLISPDRKHCWIVDFGIALSSEDLRRLTDSDAWIGTPGYMSPEQQNCDDLDASDDIYVLGVCLYESLCGKQLPHGSYQALNAINELIPPAIDELIQRCIANKPARLQRAQDFRTSLRSALHKHRALSEVLAAGPLHEVVAAIREMTPTQFMQLKAGQRLLILQKCQDLVKSTNRNLVVAREEFLEVLAYLGILLPNGQYAQIIMPAIECGFGGHDDGFGQKARGVQKVREALIDASSDVTVPNHKVIVAALLERLLNIQVDQQKAGFCHSIRPMVAALMANPECDDADAAKLAELLRSLNEHQRSLQDSASESTETGY